MAIISTLVEIVLAGLNKMEKLQEWEEIEMAVDSGATETVVGDDMVKGCRNKARGSHAKRCAI